MGDARIRPAWLVPGAALVLVSLFLRWYTGSIADIDLDKATGWAWLRFLDLYLVAVAVLALVLAGLRSAGRPEPAPALAVLQGAVALALFLVAYRVVSPPSGRSGFVVEVTPSAGPFVAGLGLVVLLSSTRLPTEPRARRRVSS